MIFKKSKEKKEKVPSPTIKEIKFMLYRIRQSPLSLMGSGIILFFALVGILAPILAPPNPSWDIAGYEGKNPFILPRVSYVTEPQPPSLAHPFGLTPEGFDIYYGAVWGAITAFRVGIYVVGLSLIIGITVGLLAGYYGGIIDEILMRFTDIIIIFPGLVLAMAFALALPQTLSITLREMLPIFAIISLILTISLMISKGGPSWKWVVIQDAAIITLIVSVLIFTGNLPNVNIISFSMTKLDKVLIALVLVGWPGYTRVIRGEVLRVRSEDYIEAAKASGCSDFRIISRHILPNAVYPILILASMDIGSIVLTAAALSFLRVGAEMDFADWGQLVEKSQTYMGTGSSLIRYWYIWVIPGAFIFLFSLGWNLLGDAIRDIMDPTLRRR
ncbi:MAG: ABC transporter permease [Candidatus Bathyarchaeota archaeon]|jgi:peptide/nickel transport system permease protein|nr:ABC transporter permease [Candidatus Bathyarchaeota archaeon A05DMB-5]MDH7557888.1 ABC transporter permease [Candidatus Bathyarchaeota archaeon]